jgi:hypothetical protein
MATYAPLISKIKTPEPPAQKKAQSAKPCSCRTIYFQKKTDTSFEASVFF